MDFNYQSIAPDGTAIFANDSQLLVRFYIHSELSQHKSKLAGAPVYDDVEVIEIRNPGEKDPVTVAADEFHKRRFPKQYEAFKQGLSVEHTGTPLDLLFPSSPSTVKSLKSLNIYSIQQLAEITDGSATNIPMGITLRDKARAYLKNASAGKGFHEVEELKRRLEQMQAMLSDAGITPPETPAVTQERRGPGRPRKEKETV